MQIPITRKDHVAFFATPAGVLLLSMTANSFCHQPANSVAKSANQGNVNAKFNYKPASPGSSLAL